jgi:hypothetical protein
MSDIDADGGKRLSCQLESVRFKPPTVPRGGGNGLPFHFSSFELGVGDEQMPNQSLECRNGTSGDMSIRFTLMNSSLQLPS